MENTYPIIFNDISFKNQENYKSYESHYVPIKYEDKNYKISQLGK